MRGAASPADWGTRQQGQDGANPEIQAQVPRSRGLRPVLVLNANHVHRPLQEPHGTRRRRCGKARVRRGPGGDGAGGASDAAAGAAAPADAAKGPSCSGCFALKTCDLPEATKGSYAREKRIISSPQELTAKSVGKSK